jgi:hypothetical protein
MCCIDRESTLSEEYRAHCLQTAALGVASWPIMRGLQTWLYSGLLTEPLIVRLLWELDEYGIRV